MREPMTDPMHGLTFADLLRQHAAGHPERAAVVCGTDRYAYPQLDERVNRLANALRGAGVGTGDRVLWLGQNCHRVLEGLLAANRIGAVFCPANWRWSAAEMAFGITDAAPKVVIWQDREIGEAVHAVREGAGGGALWLRHDASGDGTYEAFLAGGAPDDPAVDVDPLAPLLMIYTAAFEGRPNGALLTSAGLIAQDLVMMMVQRVGPDDVYLNCGPLFHIWTFINCSATFHAGGTNIFTPRVEAAEVCRLIHEQRCTRAFVMGPTVNEILEINKDRKYDLSSLLAMPGPPEWMEMVSQDDTPWGRRPGGYGQTEVAGMATLSCLGGQGSHGRVSPVCRVRVVDADDRELPPGEVGEICVRGPIVMTGYHNRPELNAARQRGGWHHTNDLGRVEADGSLSFIGPKTTMIKSAAENIYPAEVEACLMRHPAVQEACVIGVPDPVWTQSVKALVVLRPGQTATAEDIIEHCRASIASYKKPRVVEFVAALPRTPAGLIDRAAADAAHGGGGYPGVG